MREEGSGSFLRRVLLGSILIPVIVVPIGFLTIMATRLIIKPRAIGLLPTFSQCFWCGIGVCWLLMNINLHYSMKEAQEDYLKDQSYQPTYAYDYKIENSNRIVFVTTPKQHEMKLRWAYRTYEYNPIQIVRHDQDHPQPPLYLIGNNDGKNKVFYISQAPDHVTGTQVTLHCYDTHAKYSEAYFDRTFDDYGGPDAQMVELHYISGQTEPLWPSGEREDIIITGEGPVRGAEGLNYSQRVDGAIISAFIYMAGICALFNAHFQAVCIMKELDAIKT